MKNKTIITILTIIGIIIILIFTSGCNKQLVDLGYDEFDTIVCNYDGDRFELEVDKWKDYDGEQIQIKSGNKKYLLSANKCYLVGRR